MYKSFAILCIVATVASGCASSGGYRPHTEREKHLLAHAIVGHSLDVATTSYMIGSGKAEEGNPIVKGYIDQEGEFMALKAAMLGTTYLLGHANPEQRERIYKYSAVLGYGPALWNLGICIGF